MEPPPYHRCLHFLGTRFYCSILRLHRSFQVSVGLDEASFPSRWAYTHTSIASYTLRWLLDWVRRLTQTFFQLTIPSRAQGEGPANLVNRSGFANFRVRLEAPSPV